MLEGIVNNIDKSFGLFTKILEITGSDEFSLSDLEDAGIKFKDEDIQALVDSGTLYSDDGLYSINPDSVYAKKSKGYNSESIKEDE